MKKRKRRMKKRRRRRGKASVAPEHGHDVNIAFEAAAPGEARKEQQHEGIRAERRSTATGTTTTTASTTIDYIPDVALHLVVEMLGTPPIRAEDEAPKYELPQMDT